MKQSVMRQESENERSYFFFIYRLLCWLAFEHYWNIKNFLYNCLFSFVLFYFLTGSDEELLKIILESLIDINALNRMEINLLS